MTESTAQIKIAQQTNFVQSESDFFVKSNSRSQLIITMKMHIITQIMSMNKQDDSASALSFPWFNSTLILF